MSKVRINDLARELEVKSKAITDALPELGITEKKTHSSSLEEHEAVKVRAHFRPGGEVPTSAKVARTSRVESDEIKTKIDLSHISKPGDVLNAIRKQHAVPAAPAPPPPAPAPPLPAAPVSPPPPIAEVAPPPPQAQAPVAPAAAPVVAHR